MSRPPGPLGSHERASVARLLEASRDALDDQRLDYIDRSRLAAYLVGQFDQAALAIRQGHREYLLDRITGELDRVREQLAQDGERS